MRSDRLRRWLRLRRDPRDDVGDEQRFPRDPQADRVPLLLRLSVRLLPADVREEVLGDLMELWRAEVSHRPWARRVHWLLRQPLAAAVSRLRFGRHGRKGVMSWLDVKLGLRMLARYPGLTLVGGLAMAFAIAAGAVAFELVTQIVRPTLALADGHRLVSLRLWHAQSSGVEMRALRDYGIWRRELETVEDLGAWRTIERNLIVAGGSSRPIKVAETSASAFRVAPVRPLMGRALLDSDERAGATPVVVIGEAVWRGRFDADPDVVGREVRLGRAVHTVVGVVPEDYAFPYNHRVWVPLRANPLEYGWHEGPAVRVFGRLAPGATLAEARAELTALGRRMATEHPDTHEHLRPQVMGYTHAFMDVADAEFRMAAIAVNGSIVLFLILVCANVAALVFARTATRESEIVVRSALGASRGRIVGQLFAEALVLGAVAAVVGLAAAELGLRWGLSVFETIQGERLPFWIDVGLGPEALVYAGLLTALAATVSGVIPALKATRGLQARLREAGTGSTGLRFGRVWAGVIVTQVAFTVAFLPFPIKAGMDTSAIGSPDFGVPAERYLSARLEMDRPTPPVGSADSAHEALRARVDATYRDVERRLSAEPAVAGVTFAGRLPGAYHPRHLIEVEGVPLPSGSTLERQTQTASVGVDFFDVLGASIASGRGFDAADVAEGRRAVIVNRSFVERFVRDRNPIGRRVRYLCTGENCSAPAAEPGPWHEIVGVVDDVRLAISPDLPHNAGLYHPVAPGEAPELNLLVQVRGEPENFAPQLRALIADVDPALRLYYIRSLDEIHWDLLMSYRFWLRVAFAGSLIVLLLSNVGIYSIVSFTVARRTREIGIRAALGAGPRRIVRTVLTRALAQLGLGVAAGTALMFALMVGDGSGLPSARVFGTIALGAAIVVAVGVAACIVPARRALRIEPTVALRADA